MWCDASAMPYVGVRLSSFAHVQRLPPHVGADSRNANCNRLVRHLAPGPHRLLRYEANTGSSKPGIARAFSSPQYMLSTWPLVSIGYSRTLSR